MSYKLPLVHILMFWLKEMILQESLDMNALRVFKVTKLETV